MPRIGYGAWIANEPGVPKELLIRVPEDRVRQVLLQEFPEELVDRVLSRLRRQVERELRRL